MGQKPKSSAEIQTEVVDLDGGHLPDVPLDKKVYVREDNERGSQWRSGVVLNNEVITLELPVDITISLHLREGVAA